MRGELWYGHADMNTGRRTKTTYGALDAFFPGVLALGGDLDRAKRLQDSAAKMWAQNGVEPEVFNYQTMKVEYAGYPLRPEIDERVTATFQDGVVTITLPKAPGATGTTIPVTSA